MESTHLGISDNVLLILYLIAILLVCITWYVLRVEKRFRYIADKDEKVATMLAVLSTQLRSPITSINWYAELILEQDFGKLKVAQIEALDKIKRGSEQASAVVERILELSKLDRGEVELKNSSVELGSMISKIVKANADAADAKNIVLDFDKPVTATTCYADPIVLHNIIESLIQNAIQFSHDDQTVQISLANEIDTVSIHVHDDGIGISAEEQPKIYSKFFRGQQAKLMHPTGNGLSLYIAKELLLDMKGSISFKSEKNSGTTFSITLPQSKKA